MSEFYPVKKLARDNGFDVSVVPGARRYVIRNVQGFDMTFCRTLAEVLNWFAIRGITPSARGRVPGSAKIKKYGFRWEQAELDGLERLARRDDIPASEVVRRAVKHWLAWEGTIA